MLCLLADVPEMVFDAVICALMIKLVAWDEFGLLPAVMFVLMMTVFDLLAQTVGIVCVKLLRQFGKFSMMFARYVLMVALLVIGMIPSEALTGGLTASMGTDISAILTVLIGLLAVTYLVMWGLTILISWRLFNEE